MKKIILAAALCAVAVPAFAKPQCTYYPKEERVSVNKLQKQLLDQGYTIREFDYENNCFEVKLLDKDGQRIKQYLDTKSGKVVDSYNNDRRDSKRDRNW